MKIKYIPKFKLKAFEKKYSEKLFKIFSEKHFDEQKTINHLLKLMNINKNELADELENLKEESNYFIKIQDSLKGFNLTLSLNLKKNKTGKLKLCVKIKKNAVFKENQKDIIDFVKKEIWLGIFGDLI